MNLIARVVIDMDNAIKVFAKKLEQQGVTPEMINTAIEGGIEEKIKKVLIENGYHAGIPEAAKVVLKIFFDMVRQETLKTRENG